MSVGLTGKSHPFLICSRDTVAELRRKAVDAPCYDMVVSARRILDEVHYDAELSIDRQCTQIRDLMGAGALLYLLEQQPEHLKLIVELMETWAVLGPEVARLWDAAAHAEYFKGGNRWYCTVPTSSAYFNSVLALDIVHDDLEPEQLARYETTLQGVADWFWAEFRGWCMATYGPRAIWAAYRGEDRLPQALDDYRQAVFNELTADGVGRPGPEYSHGRLNGERTAKYGFLHVAEFTGLDRSYYQDHRLQSFYEWLYSAACSPFHTYVTFCDAGHGRSFNSFYPQSGTWAAGHFGEKTAGYAARRIRASQAIAPGDLLAYCIATPFAEERTPVSRVWPQGAALFYDSDPTEQALMAELWNQPEPTHSHPDANAIYFAGYGEHLLLNSGYAHYNASACGYSWDYIHNTTRASNTLMVNAEEHSVRGGEGIVEHLLSPALDYACGRVERALPEGMMHDRNLCFVRPSVGISGYLVMFDQVSGGTGTITTALHPASHCVRTDRPGERYTWNVRRRLDKDTFLTVLYATPTEKVLLEEGVLAGWDKSFVGTYALATYPLESTANLVTVMYPHDDAHPGLSMSRVAGEGWSGARVEHAKDVVDWAVALQSGMETNIEGVVLCGEAAVWRSDELEGFFFVKNGFKFYDPEKDYGFESEMPVSFVMHGNSGRVLSSGGNLSLQTRRLKNVLVNGQSGCQVNDNDGRCWVKLPAGECEIELIEG